MTQRLDVDMIKPSPDIVNALHQHGFARVWPENLRAERVGDRHLLSKAFLSEQAPDPEPGRRWRSYSALRLAGEQLSPMPHTPYLQSMSYNADAGGNPRHFRPVDSEAIHSSTLVELVAFNARLARAALPELLGATPLKVGLHMVSYRPTAREVATSSPAWLHRDQEPFVAVVLFELSGNLGGGDNLIAADGGRISEVVTLREPLEQLVLTQRPLHAVTPMFSRDGRNAWRNVLLITFSEGS